MGLRLLLMRHGQSQWNEAGRYQGQADIPLSQLGQQQAAALAQRLASEPIAAVHCSDLQRALATAEMVARPHALPAQADPLWRELAFGAWEGLSYQEIAERFPADWHAWLADPVSIGPPGGESLTRLAERVRQALAAVRARSPADGESDTSVAVVSHAGTLQVLLCLALGVDLSRYWQFRLDHGSLSLLWLYQEGAILALLNDCSHLSGRA